MTLFEVEGKSFKPSATRASSKHIILFHPAHIGSARFYGGPRHQGMSKKKPGMLVSSTKRALWRSAWGGGRERFQKVRGEKKVPNEEREPGWKRRGGPLSSGGKRGGPTKKEAAPQKLASAECWMEDRAIPTPSARKASRYKDSLCQEGLMSG